MLNPFVHVKFPAIHPKPKKNGLDGEQVKKLIVLPSMRSHTGIRDRAMLSLMVECCLQVWQVVDLNVENVDLAAECVHVRSRSGKPYIEYLSPQASVALRRWINVRGLFAVDTNALFVAMHWTAGRKQPGGRLSTRGVRDVVDGYLHKLGLKSAGVSSNALRRVDR